MDLKKFLSESSGIQSDAIPSYDKPGNFRKKSYLTLLTLLGALSGATMTTSSQALQKGATRHEIIHYFTLSLEYVLFLGKETGSTMESWEPKGSDVDITTQLINLFINVNELFMSPTTDSYENLLEDMLMLAGSLGLTQEEIAGEFEKIQ
jgi:dimeric dUTPase (all-alpha-NTP-PPase superfamily)